MSTHFNTGLLTPWLQIPLVPFSGCLKVGDVLVELIANRLRRLDGCPSRNATLHLPNPAIDPLLLLLETAGLNLNLLAELALFRLSVGDVWKFHSTGLPRSVLLGAMLFEVAPLVVATSHHVLVVEAHVDGV